MFPRATLPALLVAMLVACAGAGDGGDAVPEEFPGFDGKSDVFGRALAGVAAPYPANTKLEGLTTRLRSDMRLRRDVGWETARKVLEPVPLLGLVESAGMNPEIKLPGGEIPKVPRFQTWYGVDDLKRMFQHLYESQGPEARAARRPFKAADIDEVFDWNAKALERATAWSLDRYIKYVNDLGVCPPATSAEDCAAILQGNVAGATSGISRIMYSPATARAILESYDKVLTCLTELDALPVEAKPAMADNFSLCFHKELPADAVLVKAQWRRVDFDPMLATFDTDAATLRKRMDGSAHWNDDGDRKTNPGADAIYTIRLRNKSTYRLVGIHVMTKELRHWQWVTLWWSDKPDEDFGADRPFEMAALAPLWSRYKMCAVSWFEEEDTDPAARYGDAPTLAAALGATSTGAGQPTWCSNPYIEHGRNNARTNCIGCHQHGGATMGPDLDADGKLDFLRQESIIQDELHFPKAGRASLRELFPADYLWSLNRSDDWAGMILGEVRYWDTMQ